MKKAAKAVDKLIYKLNSGLGNVFSLALAVLAIFVFLNVVSRFVGIALPWLFSLSVITLVAFTFFTAAYTLGEGKHVTIDVVTLRLPENSRVSLEILGYVFCLFFCIILGWEGTKWLHTAFVRKIITGSDTLSTLAVPLWIFIFVVPAGAFLLILQLLRLIVKRTYFLVNRHANLTTTLVPLVSVLALFVGGLLTALYISPISGLFLSLLVLFMGGTPVAFALAIVGTIGIYLFAGGSSGLVQVPMVAFAATESFPLAALPLFVLISAVVGQAGMAKALFSFTELWFGRVRGSLLIVTIATGAVFCAITGSSVAATAILCMIALPALLDRGFDVRLSCGTVGGASVGSLIPPSTSLIIYGTVVEMSIGKLFMAALIPSLIVFALYAMYVILLSFVSGRKFGRKTEAVSWREKFLSLKTAAPLLLLPILILGGIYTGLFTATEAAGFAVVYGLLVVLIILGTLKWKGIRQACLESCTISSMTLFVLVGGMIFATIVSQLKIAPTVVSFAKGVGASQLAVIVIMFLALLVGGMFMSSIALMLITLPVFYPLAMAVGIDPLWLGVFYTICIEIGLLTPPVGVNLFVIKGASDVPFDDIVVGMLPFLGILTLGIAIIYLFPQLCTWLPSTM
jgi:C4-dicarboxylate transporter DctM subunit